MKVILNILLWCISAIILSNYIENIFGDGSILFVFAIVTLGLCGSIIQSVFIINNYYNQGKIAILYISLITLLLTILIFVSVILVFGYEQLWLEMLVFIKIAFIPCLVITFFSYLISKRKYA